MAKSKHQKSGNLAGSLLSLQAAVENLRDFFDGDRALGINIKLVDSIGKITAAYAAVRSKNNRDWEAISERLGHPTDEMCEFVLLHLKKMPSAIFGTDRKTVEEIVSALESRSFMATLASQSPTENKVTPERLAETIIHNAARGSRARPAIDRVPTEQYKAVGYGLREVSDWDARLSAMQSVLSSIDGESLPSPEAADGFRKVAEVFASVAACDTPDWYSLSRFLGHPSSAHCLPLSNALYAMAEAVKFGQGGAYADLQSFILDGFAGEMLETYVGLATGQDYSPEEGMVYIAWSSSDRSALQIGIADGGVDDELRALDTETDHPHRYGLLATWLVHDIDHARDNLGNLLRQWLMPSGGYALGIGKARDIIDTALAAADNLILTPWHDEYDTKPKSVPALALG